VVLHQEGPLAAFLQRAGIGFSLLPWSDFAQGKRATYAADKLNIKAAQSRFAECLQANSIDLVHSNDTQIGCTWIGSAALGGARFVWHQRTSGGKHLFKHFAAKADRVFCPSAYIRERLVESLKVGFPGTGSRGRQILQVNNPISLSRYSAPSCPESVGTDGYPRVGFVANARAQKRPEIFLAAAARVLEAFPDARFVLAGAFSDEARREVLATLSEQVVGRVELLGFVEDRQSLFRRMDVLMVPAVNEGFGRTLVEAMLAGVAVVAADSGGHREIIKHGRTGLLIPPDDVTAFAEAVCQLARDPNARRRLVVAAKEDASAGYDPSTVSRQVAEIYRQLPQVGIIRRHWRVLRDRWWLSSMPKGVTSMPRMSLPYT
jgi:glycosyltransferase involved in cell wall biosynthesis